jgi:phosphohistidine swiveling domain-containing protein
VLRGERHVEISTSPLGVGLAVLEERDLDRVSVGCVVVTSVGGPALSAVLPRAAGVVAELGGSTSHLAAPARERGIPAVLGARGATRLPEGATVAVDGITGVVRWAGESRRPDWYAVHRPGHREGESVREARAGR